MMGGMTLRVLTHACLSSAVFGFGIESLAPALTTAAAVGVGALSGLATAGRSSRLDTWLNDWTQKTRGAAALFALTDAGVIDALPEASAPCGASAGELISTAAARDAEHAPAAASADAVARLLRHLALLRVVDESPAWRFRHTARSRALVAADAADGGLARARVLSGLSPALVRPWWRVADAIREGGDDARAAPFALEHGAGVWEWLARDENARDARRFDALMRGLSEDDGGARPSSDGAASLVAHAASARAFDWAALPARSRVVDVGGGEGQLLAAVLRAHRHLDGVCVDRLDVASRARANLASRGLAPPRARAEAGSFFDPRSLPRGGAVYVLKWVLHDWPDADAARALRAVRAAMLRGADDGDGGGGDDDGDDGGRRAPPPQLLVLERVVGDGARDGGGARVTDAHMWVCFGGRERSVAQFARLLDDAGFAVRRVTPLEGDKLVAIEAEPC